MTIFDLNHVKQCLPNFAKFELFPELTRFTFVFKTLERLWTYKKSQYWNLKKAETSYKKKVIYAENRGKS